MRGFNNASRYRRIRARANERLIRGHSRRDVRQCGQLATTVAGLNRRLAVCSYFRGGAPSSAPVGTPSSVAQLPARTASRTWRGSPPYGNGRWVLLSLSASVAAQLHPLTAVTDYT